MTVSQSRLYYIADVFCSNEPSELRPLAELVLVFAFACLNVHMRTH